MRYWLLVLLIACGGNSREGEFYGEWTLSSTRSTQTDSCVGSQSFNGTVGISPGAVLEIAVVVRGWPPCGSGVQMNVDGDSASGNESCDTTDGSDTVTNDVQNLTLTLDSTGYNLAITGTQVVTDQSTGSACDLTLNATASKPNAQ
ncbi:MAG TPA: hypothetical protein VGG74_32935 [Kofleriaceae bacterium]|jgi:hypothetical protein